MGFINLVVVPNRYRLGKIYILNETHLIPVYLYEEVKFLMKHVRDGVPIAMAG
jgi:hypothetical protein